MPAAAPLVDRIIAVYRSSSDPACSAAASELAALARNGEAQPLRIHEAGARMDVDAATLRHLSPDWEADADTIRRAAKRMRAAARAIALGE